MSQPKLCKACETVAHCTAHGCIPAREATPSPTAGMNMAQRILHVGGRNPSGSTYVEFGSIQAVEALVKQVLRDRKPAPESVLHHALAVAVDHIDIEALRISHCKDAATIEAALAATPQAQLAVYAARYEWLRSHNLDALQQGGVFAGKTPDNVVLNGADLDAERRRF